MLASWDLAISLKLAAILILGDSQYERGAPDACQKSWVFSWGRKN
jgi:hypothetical protein